MVQSYIVQNAGRKRNLNFLVVLLYAGHSLDILFVVVCTPSSRSLRADQYIVHTYIYIVHQKSAEF
jgi:hypothetical protein